MSAFSYRKCIGLLAILSLVRAEEPISSEQAFYLDCAGPNVTIPYCLQCDGCRMECGGPKVVVPWCRPCQDQCDPDEIEPPQQGIYSPKRLGEDGKPFIVGQWQLDTALAESTDKEMVWAGEVKWNVAPQKEMENSAAVCWGVKAEDGSDKLVYQCVNAGL
ncbi:hypothetical protein FPANT_589 [Fusarium pseudoanthophilum]|uniref:Uncharacterized protein n=1 Tax=Fusarium pseudoanthophilum TaxID=48495 RepID=A0A8H5Q3V4_9HYPO|nr:hypothetical protein FPANT_589 [Fusarium pseudoanthophilum]